VAAYAYSKGALISVDTDGVMASCPFPEGLVPEGFGDGLGQWKQDHYAALLFWQNGIYWLRDLDGRWKEAKTRGIPKGVIPLEKARDALESGSLQPPFTPPAIRVRKTKYIGYRAALGGHRFGDWRRWIDEETTIVFGGQGKGTHLPPFCARCRGQHSGMHTVTHFPPKEMESEPHHLPWLEAIPDTTTGELGSDIFSTDDEIFADTMLEDRL